MIKKKYFWKEISNDGLLKEPPEFGLSSFYPEDSLNKWGYGQDSEEDALKALEEISKKYEYQVPRNLTLIVEYRYHDEE